MKPNTEHLSRRRFLTAVGAAVGAAAVGSTALDLLAAPSASAATAFSSVDTSRSTYDKLVLMSNGQPFFHSGIQFRYEKHKYTNGWTDAQLKPVLKMIADDGFKVVNIPIWWSQVESSKDVFTWTDINRYFDWCEEYGLKLELLWFGHESTGITLAPRLPDYVLSDYQLVLASDGTPLSLNGNNLLDKTDPRLLSREKYVLGRLIEHIASYDSQGTMVGVQVLNEPNVATMQWGSSADRSYSDYSTDRWNSGSYNDAAQFRKDVLLDYLTQLGAVIKQSDYVVYTRTNVVGDAKPIAENEKLRTAGTSTIDFFGNDPYTTSSDSIYFYGTSGTWAQGRNFPMIMENYGGNSTADVLKFNALAGNAAYNYYAALDPDSSSGSSSYGLYDFDPSTKAVTRKTVSTKVASLNAMLNKISRDLATKAPVEAGGSRLQTFNRKATASVDITKSLDGLSVRYTTSSSGQGLAVERNSNTGVVLLSTAAATFTVTGDFGAVTSVQSGYYNAGDTWVSNGNKSGYTASTGSIEVPVSAYECVRVTYTG